jgi:Protein of unknown function (DUF2000)
MTVPVIDVPLEVGRASPPAARRRSASSGTSRSARSLLSPGGERTSVQYRLRRPSQAEVMRFDTKIAIAVREDLAAWQTLNVTAFLASAVAGGFPEVIGERVPGRLGHHTYLPMFRQPAHLRRRRPAAQCRARPGTGPRAGQPSSNEQTTSPAPH